MVDVWGSFARGAQIGGALREASERRQREQAYGQAFDQGGWGAVAKQAGSVGDLETAIGIQAQQSEQEERAYDRAVRNATVLGNAATSLMGVPYEQRGARLQQMAPMLEQMGLDPQQIAAFDPTDEALSSIRAVQGQFSQYIDIRQQGDAIVGIRPDGTAEVIHQGRPSAPTGHQWNQGGTALERIPGYDPGEAGAGSAGALGAEQYSMLDAGEAESMGLPPGSYQRNNATGQVTVVGRTRGQYTEGASGAAQFASRMAAAHQTLVGLENAQVSPEGVFLAQSGFGDENERLVRQAQREFVNAILRRESGAVISDSEFRSASQQYFPQPGDTRAVLEQKRAARQRALQGLINASQGAYEEWYGPGSGGELPPPPLGPGEGIGGDIGALINRQRNAPQAGAGQAPAGLSQEEWNVMTPEERALWQN